MTKENIRVGESYDYRVDNLAGRTKVERLIIHPDTAGQVTDALSQIKPDKYGGDTWPVLSVGSVWYIDTCYSPTIISYNFDGKESAQRFNDENNIPDIFFIIGAIYVADGYVSSTANSTIHIEYYVLSRFRLGYHDLNPGKRAEQTISSSYISSPRLMKVSLETFYKVFQPLTWSDESAFNELCRSLFRYKNNRSTSDSYHAGGAYYDIRRGTIFNASDIAGDVTSIFRAVDGDQSNKYSSIPLDGNARKISYYYGRFDVEDQGIEYRVGKSARNLLVKRKNVISNPELSFSSDLPEAGFDYCIVNSDLVHIFIKFDSTTNTETISQPLISFTPLTIDGKHHWGFSDLESWVAILRKLQRSSCYISPRDIEKFLTPDVSSDGSIQRGTINFVSQIRQVNDKYYITTKPTYETFTRHYRYHMSYAVALSPYGNSDFLYRLSTPHIASSTLAWLDDTFSDQVSDDTYSGIPEYNTDTWTFDKISFFLDGGEELYSVSDISKFMTSVVPRFYNRMYKSVFTHDDTPINKIFSRTIKGDTFTYTSLSYKYAISTERLAERLHELCQRYEDALKHIGVKPSTNTFIDQITGIYRVRSIKRNCINLDIPERSPLFEIEIENDDIIEFFNFYECGEDAESFVDVLSSYFSAIHVQNCDIGFQYIIHNNLPYLLCSKGEDIKYDGKSLDVSDGFYLISAYLFSDEFIDEIHSDSGTVTFKHEYIRMQPVVAASSNQTSDSTDIEKKEDQMTTGKGQQRRGGNSESEKEESSMTEAKLKGAESQSYYSLDTAKADAIQGLVRSGGRQLEKNTRKVVAMMLATFLKIPDEKKEDIEAFFETEMGKVMILSLLSVSLGALPDGVSVVPGLLARELRVEAVATVGDLAAELITGPVRELLVQYIQTFKKIESATSPMQLPAATGSGAGFVEQLVADVESVPSQRRR